MRAARNEDPRPDLRPLWPELARRSKFKTKGNSSIAPTDLLKNVASDRSISVHISRIAARVKSECCGIWRVWRARQGSEPLATSGGSRGASRRVRGAASREAKSAPGRIRTCDPRLRRPMLYPTELRARGFSVAGTWAARRLLSASVRPISSKDRTARLQQCPHDAGA
jgi:hypothetical protein